jgi:hypothetical protein
MRRGQGEEEGREKEGVRWRREGEVKGERCGGDREGERDEKRARRGGRKGKEGVCWRRE